MKTSVYLIALLAANAVLGQSINYFPGLSFYIPPNTELEAEKGLPRLIR
jgi:uncharacterized membrane protein